jgi:Protein of unknown function (DUF3089)
VARKFLYVIAFLLALVLAAGIVWTLYGDRLIRFAMVPRVAFAPPPSLPGNRYADVQMWHARPDIVRDNPALWTPEGYVEDVATEDSSQSGTPRSAVFFIHPTSFLDPQPKSWNADLADATANERARLFIRGQASAFNGSGDIWAPRYRQAAFGAFLTTQPEAAKALDAAYADVATAWAAFLAEAGPTRPIIVAGHSQGAVHLMRLLREQVAGKPVATRIAAAYVIGWPVSVATDLKAMGLPACTTATQASCVLSWQSFAEPADMKAIVDAYDATTGFDGRSRQGTPMLCSNPLTGVPATAAEAKANLGAVIPAADLKTGKLESGTIPARCDPRGFLLIGAPPKGIDAYVLPGNNYHVFDYSLFWSNIRVDAARRLATFTAKP